MKFRKKIIKNTIEEESQEIKELLSLAKKINIPQFTESFWKIQYNKLYQEWENKKFAYRTRVILTKSFVFIFVAAFSVFFIKFFIPGKIHNEKLVSNSISNSISKSSESEIPYGHTLGIYSPEEQIFPLKNFVDFFNYLPASMQKTIIDNELKSD